MQQDTNSTAGPFRSLGLGSQQVGFKQWPLEREKLKEGFSGNLAPLPELSCD
jgi:hypothetical protein